MFNILIVSNNYKEIEIFFNYLLENLSKEFKIINIFNDGKNISSYIINEKIDIILLDSSVPNLNIIDILRLIKYNNIKTNVILLFSDSRDIIDMPKDKFDICKILIKPFDIKELSDTINNLPLKKSNSKGVYNILNNFNFNKSSVGYIYILECLNYCIENDYTSISKLNLIYEDLALLLTNSTKSKIAWDISKAIHSMLLYTEISVLNKYFPYNNFPSPKVFFNGILELYYNNLKENQYDKQIKKS